jgi:drug/metabolite transporter (DMT)-like permease
MFRSSFPVMGLLCVAVTICFTIASQLLIKHGVTSLQSSPTQLRQVPVFILRAFTHPLVMLGLCCSVVSMASWMMALSKLKLSMAYPFLGLATVLVLVCSSLIIGESIPLLRWVGVGVVCLGLWLVVLQ